MKDKDKAKAVWRQNLMKKFKDEDYDRMNRAFLEMMGEEATEQDKELVQKLLKK